MGASYSSPVYLDAIEFYANTSNILSVPFTNVTEAFHLPVATAQDAYSGYDWSKPFPSVKLDGFQTHLTVAAEMHMNETLVQNASTVLTSLTFDAPGSLLSGAKPVAMDPSWYICRHVFITTKPSAKQGAKKDPGCTFLSDACRNVLIRRFTGNWGTATNTSMCSALMYDPIPESCFDTFGYSRQDAWAFDTTALASEFGGLHTRSAQQQSSFRIGTGYHSPYDPGAYAKATSRTYLVATVWGYSGSAEKGTIRTPDVSLSCLASDADHIPQPPPPTSTASLPTSTTSVPTSTIAPIASDKPYYDQFDNGMAQWTTYDGSFSADSKALIAPDSISGLALMQTSYTDFTFEADITVAGGSDSSRSAGLICRASSPVLGMNSYHGYYVGLSADGHAILGTAGSSWNQLASSPVDMTANQAHRLKIRAVGSKLSVWVDDMRAAKLSVTDSMYMGGMTGVMTNHSGAVFDNVQILPVSFFDDFSSKSLQKWQPYSGDFDARLGVMIAKQSGGSMAVISGRLFDNFVVEAEMSVSQNGDAGVALRITSPTDGNNGYYGYYGYYVGMSNGRVVFGRVENGWTELSSKDTSDIQPGSNHIKVMAKGPVFSVYVNNMVTPKIVISDATYRIELVGTKYLDKGASCVGTMKLLAPVIAMPVFQTVPVFASLEAWIYEAGIFYESFRAECLVKGVGNTQMAKACVGAKGGCCTMAEFLRHIDISRNGMGTPNIGQDPSIRDVCGEMISSGEYRGRYEPSRLVDIGVENYPTTHRARLVWALDLFKTSVLHLEEIGRGAEVAGSLTKVRVYRQAAVDTRTWELRKERVRYAKKLQADYPTIRRTKNSFAPDVYFDPDFDKLLKNENTRRKKAVAKNVKSFLKGMAGSDNARLHQKIVFALDGSGRIALERTGASTVNPPAPGACSR